jgi:hypothetical protein
MLAEVLKQQAPVAETQAPAEMKNRKRKINRSFHRTSLIMWKFAFSISRTKQNILPIRLPTT